MSIERFPNAYFPFIVREPSRRDRLALVLLFFAVVILLFGLVLLYLKYLSVSDSLLACQSARSASKNSFLLDANVCYCDSCASIDSFMKLVALSHVNCSVYCVGGECKRVV